MKQLMFKCTSTIVVNRFLLDMISKHLLVIKHIMSSYRGAAVITCFILGEMYFFGLLTACFVLKNMVRSLLFTANQCLSVVHCIIKTRQMHYMFQISTRPASKTNHQGSNGNFVPWVINYIVKQNFIFASVLWLHPLCFFRYNDDTCKKRNKD